MAIEVVAVDYHNPQQAQDLVTALNAYALDEMGGGEALSLEVQQNLAAKLSQLPHAFSYLAYKDGNLAGLVNCFLAFSTFSAKPLVNIHDIAVMAPFRGFGISKLLMAAVENHARQLGCCKITLEVLSGNQAALRAYQGVGFAPYELDQRFGSAQFWQKILD